MKILLSALRGVVVEAVASLYAMLHSDKWIAAHYPPHRAPRDRMPTVDELRG